MQCCDGVAVSVAQQNRQAIGGKDGQHLAGCHAHQAIGLHAGMPLGCGQHAIAMHLIQPARRPRQGQLPLHPGPVPGYRLRVITHVSGQVAAGIRALAHPTSACGHPGLHPGRGWPVGFQEMMGCGFHRHACKYHQERLCPTDKLGYLENQMSPTSCITL